MIERSVLVTIILGLGLSSASAAESAVLEAGAAAVDAWDHTNCRCWIKRTDKIGTDPFGNPTVRAMMHPNPITDYVGPAGPEDPALTVLSVVRPDDRPIALVANFSMHYLGGKDVSPDHFGPFAQAVEEATEREFPESR